MKLINIEYLKSLNPCKDRLNNAIKHYSTFEGDILDVLYLDNISSDDKIWIAIRSLPDNILHRFVIECAYSTLDNYEKKYPNDSRPRKAIEAKVAWLNNEISNEELRKAQSASHSASRSASHSVSWSARSAQSAANSAACSAEYSARSAASSAANSAVYSAAYSASSAAPSAAGYSAARIEHYELLINKLINLIEIDIILGEL